MKTTLRSLALVLAAGLATGGLATAQPSPTVEALLEQIAQLKKQLALEKARADEQAAEARAQAEEARAQAVAAARAERDARAQAERALAAAEEARIRALREQAAQPRPNDRAIDQATAAVKEAEAVLAKLTDEFAQARKVAAPGTPILARLQDQVAAARAQLEERRERLAQLTKGEGQPAPANEIDKLRKELEETRRALADSRAQVEKLQYAMKIAEAQRAVAGGEARPVEERVKALEQRLAEVEKLLKPKQEGPKQPPKEGQPEQPKQPAKNPPAEKIEGQVSKAQGGLLQLSIGSDVGLKVGHTLEMFRLGEKATYLGTVRVTDVEAKTAVAAPVGKLNAEPQAGDKVASQIK